MIKRKRRTNDKKRDKSGISLSSRLAPGAVVAANLARAPKNMPRLH